MYFVRQRVFLCIYVQAADLYTADLYTADVVVKDICIQIVLMYLLHQPTRNL